MLIVQESLRTRHILLYLLASDSFKIADITFRSHPRSLMTTWFDQKHIQVDVPNNVQYV